MHTRTTAVATLPLGTAATARNTSATTVIGYTQPANRLGGSGVPKPEYPSDATAVKPGSCLRGNITYSVERGTRPDQVIYGVEGRDPVEWTIPKT